MSAIDTRKFRYFALNAFALFFLGYTACKSEGDSGSPPTPPVDNGALGHEGPSADDSRKKKEFRFQPLTELEGGFAICAQAPLELVTDQRLQSILSDTARYFPNGVFGKLETSFTDSNLTLKLTLHKNSTCSQPALEFLGRGRFGTGVQNTPKPLDLKISEVFGTTWDSELVAVLNSNQVCDQTTWGVGSSVNLTSLTCNGTVFSSFIGLGFTTYKLEGHTRLFIGKNDASHHFLSNQSRPTEFLPIPLIRSAMPSKPGTPSNGLFEVGDIQVWGAQNSTIQEYIRGTFKKGASPQYSIKTNPLHGTIELASNGLFTYRPNCAVRARSTELMQ